MPHLLQEEVGRFAQRLEESCQIPEVAGWLTEVLSGGSNVLHVPADISPLSPSMSGGCWPYVNPEMFLPLMRARCVESITVTCCVTVVLCAVLSHV